MGNARVFDTWPLVGSYATLTRHDRLSPVDGEWGCVFATEFFQLVVHFMEALTRVEIEDLRAEEGCERNDFSMSQACARHKAAREMEKMIDIGRMIQRTEDVLNGRVSMAGIPSVLITREAVARLNRDRELARYESFRTDDGTTAHRIVPVADDVDGMLRLFMDGRLETGLIFSSIHSIVSQALRMEKGGGGKKTMTRPPCINTPFVFADEHGVMRATADDMMTVLYVASGADIQDHGDGTLTIAGEYLATAILLDTSAGFFGREEAGKQAKAANAAFRGAFDVMLQSGGHFVSANMVMGTTGKEIEIIKPSGKIVKEDER